MRNGVNFKGRGRDTKLIHFKDLRYTEGGKGGTLGFPPGDDLGDGVENSDGILGLKVVDDVIIVKEELLTIEVEDGNLEGFILGLGGHGGLGGLGGGLRNHGFLGCLRVLRGLRLLGFLGGLRLLGFLGGLRHFGGLRGLGDLRLGDRDRVGRG